MTQDEALRRFRLAKLHLQFVNDILDPIPTDWTNGNFEKQNDISDDNFELLFMPFKHLFSVTSNIDRIIDVMSKKEL